MNVLHKKLHRKNTERGAAMIIVLCAFALVVALGASALVAANAVLSVTASGVTKRQAELTAKSTAAVLVAAITEAGSDLNNAADDLADGGTLTLETADAGSGSTLSVLEKQGDVLTAHVTATLGETGYTLTARFSAVGGEWAFTAYSQG